MYLCHIDLILFVVSKYLKCLLVQSSYFQNMCSKCVFKICVLNVCSKCCFIPLDCCKLFIEYKCL